MIEWTMPICLALISLCSTIYGYIIGYQSGKRGLWDRKSTGDAPK